MPLFGKKKKKQKENVRNSLEREIKNLEKVHKSSREASVLKKLKEAKAAMNEYLNMEVEKLLSIVRQRTYDGGPKAAKVLTYKLKKQQEKASVMQLWEKTYKGNSKGPKGGSKSICTILPGSLRCRPKSC